MKGVTRRLVVYWGQVTRIQPGLQVVAVPSPRQALPLEAFVFGGVLRAPRLTVFNHSAGCASAFHFHLFARGLPPPFSRSVRW